MRPAEPRFQYPTLSLKNNLTNFDSLDFSIQYPKIHDHSLISTDSKNTWLRVQSKSYTRPPALEVHAKAAHRWLAQRSLSNHPRRAYLLNPPERRGMWIQGGNKANMAKQKKKQLSHRRHPFNHYHPLRPIGQALPRPSAHTNRHGVNTKSLCLTISNLHTRCPQLSFNRCDFLCQHVIAWSIREPW